MEYKLSQPPPLPSWPFLGETEGDLSIYVDLAFQLTTVWQVNPFHIRVEYNLAPEITINHMELGDTLESLFVEKVIFYFKIVTIKSFVRTVGLSCTCERWFLSRRFQWKKRRNACLHIARWTLFLSAFQRNNSTTDRRQFSHKFQNKQFSLGCLKGEPPCCYNLRPVQLFGLRFREIDKNKNNKVVSSRVKPLSMSVSLSLSLLRGSLLDNFCTGEEGSSSTTNCRSKSRPFSSTTTATTTKYITTILSFTATGRKTIKTDWKKKQ